MIFWIVLEHFANLPCEKDAKFQFEPESTISGYQSFEASILVYWIQRSKMIFESVSVHFANHRSAKMQNLCSGLNALFRGTKVVKHPF
jgi:hypothetical protein